MIECTTATNRNTWSTLDVEFPVERVTESLEVERIGDNLYRLHSVPLLSDYLGLNDAIEVETKDDRVIFRQLAQKSDWRTFRFFSIPGEIEGLSEIKDRVLAEGGQWESTPSLSALVVCIPGHSKYDPTSDIQGLIRG